MKFIFRQKFLLISCVILVGNCLLGYTIYHSIQKLLGAEKWVRHTEEVISQTISIFSTGKDIKTSSRDFIITNDSSNIKQLNTAATAVFTDIKKLRQLTIDNPSQQPRIDLLDLYMHKRYAFALKTIAYRSEFGFEKAIAYSSDQNNQYYSASISDVINAIRAAEKDLLKQRTDNNARLLDTFNQLSVLVFVLMTAFIIILLITTGNYLLQNKEKGKRAAELVIANAELRFQNDEKEKRANELVIANKELIYQSSEKEKRAAELIIADEELFHQNSEKDKRAAELIIADEELSYQNNEKDKRAAELVIANKELLFQSNEKEKRAAELVIANKELLYENDEKEKRANELVIANEELSYQNREKEKRAVELAFANQELLFQNDVRRIVEKNLSQSESRLKEAQAIAHIGNFELDLVNGKEIWSDEMFKIYGVVKDDVTPSSELFLSFIHQDDVKRIAADMDELFKTFKSSVSDFRFIHQDGSIRYAYVEAKFEFDDDKKPIRLFGIMQDVTDDRLADLERVKMVNDLMTRNNDLEQFAYIISHNLRAPVANIIGASIALNDVDVSDEDKDTLNKAISTSVMRLDDVIQDLNHILQIKSGINETHEIVRFSGLVDDIKASIKNLIEKDVDIQYDFSDCDEFLTIKTYLYSIFYNLISNSLKYCRPEIHCNINIKSLVEKNVLKLIFNDNGLGIDLKKKGDQIFGLYKRFHENLEGKGMGLYMVKTQVEILGGKISITSEENVGTEFVIEFNLNA